MDTSAIALLCGTAIYLTERILRERAKGLDKAPQPAPKREPMPADIALWAMNESEPWAREQAVSAAEDLYARTGDWNRVRAELMLTNGER